MVIRLDNHLDQTVVRPRYTQRCDEVISLAKETIRSRLRGKTERRRQPGDTPMAIKYASAKDITEKTHSDLSGITQQEGQAQLSYKRKNIMKKWAKKK